VRRRLGLGLGLCLGLLSLGCVSTTYDHGVPNLHQVRPNAWRSGQPTGSEAWKYLAGLGIKYDVKLDFDDEGSDDLAAAQGIAVFYLPIEPSTKAGFLDSVVDVFAVPDPAKIAQIRAQLAKIGEDRRFDGGWIIHCKNGHDRTGFVVGMLRVIADGWDKHHAWGEMLEMGYHPELIGLDRAFHDFSLPPPDPPQPPAKDVP